MSPQPGYVISASSLHFRHCRKRASSGYYWLYLRHRLALRTLMIAQLTRRAKSRRPHYPACVVRGRLLLMAAAGVADPLAFAGAIVLLAQWLGSVRCHFWLLRPRARGRSSGQILGRSQPDGHYPRDGLGRALGLFVGDWIALAARLSGPDLRCRVVEFRRLRPVHTSGVIFGFGGNALIATSFYVLQRTSRARLPDQFESAGSCCLATICSACIAATGYLMGITQSKEYAEPEWYADIWLVIVWVIYFIVYLRTLARRKEPHIYVSNWYYMAFILVVAVLHIVNNLAMPVSLGQAKSYSAFSGVQDAMTQWWYGHNAVAFFLTAGFLGMMYYYLPKRAPAARSSPIGCRSSASGASPSCTMWAGSHHLHYTALPQWVQTLGMTFSVMLLVPSWASAGNALLTLNGAWHKVRDDATLRFMMVAAVFYGLVTFEGSFMAIRTVQLAVALYRLDRRPRPCWRARLGGDDYLRRDLRVGAVALETRADVFRAGWSKSTSGSLHRRNGHLRFCDVEFRHHPGADVADLQ